MIDNNPNASVAVGTGVLGILTVWLVGVAGVDMPPEVSAVVPVALTTTVLFIGRRGLQGFLKLLWKGDPDLGNSDNPDG